MLVKYLSEEGFYLRRLLAAISRWASAHDANEREFAEEVLERIESHARLAEIKKQNSIN